MFQWTILTDRHDLVYVSQPAHGDYEIWRSFFNRAVSRPWRVAQLITMPRGSALRVRDGANIRTHVVRGIDPLKYSVGESTFEILHVGIGSGGRQAVKVFCRSAQQLSTRSANLLLAALQRQLHTQDIFLGVRHDPWFIGYTDFPVMYWFSDSLAPDIAEWKHAPRIECRASDVQPCRGFNLSVSGVKLSK
jgi:hypothetical protein